MLTEEDLRNIKSLLDEQSQRLEQRLDRLEERMDRLEERMDRLEERMDRLEKRMDRLEKRVDILEEELTGFQRYTVQQLTVMENYMSSKFSALFDMQSMHVNVEQYRKRNTEIDSQLDYITPLKETVQSHSRKLQRHEEILKELAAC